MKIAIFHNLSFGGAKVSIYEIAKRLRINHNIQVDYYRYDITDENILDLSEVADNTYTYLHTRLPKSTGYNPFKKIFLYFNLKRIDKIIASDINKRGYDIAFIHHSTHVQCPMILRYINLPIVYFCQDPFRRGYEKKMASTKSLFDVFRAYLLALTDIFLKKIDQHNISFAHSVLVNSCYSSEAISRIYGVNTKVVYLGVDTNKYRPGENRREDYIMSVGLLTPTKGFDFLIRAVANIPEIYRPPLVIFNNIENSVTGKSYRDFLLELANQLDVVLVLRDGKNTEALIEGYQRARVVAFTPYLEPLGIVPLEAMACGTPVVGVREAGVRETVIDGFNGLTTNRDIDEFSGAITKLINDPLLWNSLAKNCRSSVINSWSWDSVALRVFKEFDRIMKP